MDIVLRKELLRATSQCSWFSSESNDEWLPIWEHPGYPFGGSSNVWAWSSDTNLSRQAARNAVLRNLEPNVIEDGIYTLLRHSLLVAAVTCPNTWTRTCAKEGFQVLQELQATTNMERKSTIRHFSHYSGPWCLSDPPGSLTPNCIWRILKR